MGACCSASSTPGPCCCPCLPAADVFLAMWLFLGVEAFAGFLTAAYIWLLLTPARIAMLPFGLLCVAPRRLGGVLLGWIGGGDQAAAKEKLEDAAAAALVATQQLCSRVAGAGRGMCAGACWLAALHQACMCVPRALCLWPAIVGSPRNHWSVHVVFLGRNPFNSLEFALRQASGCSSVAWPIQRTLGVLVGSLFL